MKRKNEETNSDVFYIATDKCFIWDNQRSTQFPFSSMRYPSSFLWEFTSVAVDCRETLVSTDIKMEVVISLYYYMDSYNRIR